MQQDLEESPSAPLRLLEIVGPYRPPGLNGSSFSPPTAPKKPPPESSSPCPATPPLATRSRLASTVPYYSYNQNLLDSCSPSPWILPCTRPQSAFAQLGKEHEPSAGQRLKIPPKWKTTSSIPQYRLELSSVEKPTAISGTPLVSPTLDLKRKINEDVEALSQVIQQGLTVDTESDCADDEDEDEDSDSQAGYGDDLQYSTDYSDLEFSSDSESGLPPPNPRTSIRDRWACPIYRCNLNRSGRTCKPLDSTCERAASLDQWKQHILKQHIRPYISPSVRYSRGRLAQNPTSPKDILGKLPPGSPSYTPRTLRRAEKRDLATGSPGSDSSGSYVLVDSNSTGRSNTSNSTSNPPSSAPGRTNARRKSSDNNGNYDSDSESSTPNRKRPRRSGPDPTMCLGSRSYGCPYYLHNPNDPSHQRCKNKRFPNLSRVKGHVLRSHVKPRQCPRCGFRAGDQGQINHHLQVKNCEKVDVVPLDPCVVRVGGDLARNGKSKTWTQICMLLFECSEEDCPSPWADDEGASPGSSTARESFVEPIAPTPAGPSFGETLAAAEDPVMQNPEFRAELHAQVSSILSEILPPVISDLVPSIISAQLPILLARYRERLQTETPGSPSSTGGTTSNSGSMLHHSTDTSPLMHNHDYVPYNTTHAQSGLNSSPYAFLGAPTEEHPLIPFNANEDPNYPMFMQDMQMMPPLHGGYNTYEFQGAQGEDTHGTAAHDQMDVQHDAHEGYK